MTSPKVKWSRKARKVRNRETKHLRTLGSRSLSPGELKRILHRD